MTGTPGIGKSLFGVAFVIDLIRFCLKNNASPSHLAPFGMGLNGRIIYESRKSATAKNSKYFLIDTGLKQIKIFRGQDPEWIDDPNVFMVKDGPCEDSQSACSVLWLSSPRPGPFQDAIRKPTFGVKLLFMPPWTADELSACWKKSCAPEQLFDCPDEEAYKHLRFG